MSQADHSDQQNTSHRESSDDRTEFERLLRLVAHGFEGTSEKNLPRLQPFVPSFRTCRHVLDIGCGEGLMLELLRDAGTKASGIDIDPDRVAAAHAKGLEATTAEAHAYLRATPGAFDGIFLRHIIEHFDGLDGLRLLHFCRKALQSSGVIIVITPNFRMAEVAEQMFWLDITHRRPYPLPLLQHIFVTLGIDVVECGMREKEAERDLFIIGHVPKGL